MQSVTNMYKYVQIWMFWSTTMWRMHKYLTLTELCLNPEWTFAKLGVMPHIVHWLWYLVWSSIRWWFLAVLGGSCSFLVVLGVFLWLLSSSFFGFCLGSFGIFVMFFLVLWSTLGYLGVLLWYFEVLGGPSWWFMISLVHFGVFFTLQASTFKYRTLSIYNRRSDMCVFVTKFWR